MIETEYFFVLISLFQFDLSTKKNRDPRFSAIFSGLGRGIKMSNS